MTIVSKAYVLFLLIQRNTHILLTSTSTSYTNQIAKGHRVVDNTLACGTYKPSSPPIRLTSPSIAQQHWLNVTHLPKTRNIG